MICARAISADRVADLDLAFARLQLSTREREALEQTLPHFHLLLTELADSDRALLKAAVDASSEVHLLWGRDVSAALLSGRRGSLRGLVERSRSTAPELAAAIEAALRLPQPVSLRLPGRSVHFGGRTQLMGVINVTPDSFSDGGDFFDPGRAVSHGLEMVAAGADFLDLGGESTRPGAAEVEAAEELRRVVPVLRSLRAQTEVPISVDTRKAKVAEAAIELGADLINDVSGLQFDPKLAAVIGRSSAACCVMHAQGLPQTMQNDPRYRDLIAEIRAFLDRSMGQALEAGIERERILVDPGIGFGKTADQNLHILRRLSDFRALGRPILVGTSRKSFLGRLSGNKPPRERLWATLGSVAAVAASGSADLLRVHDLREAKDAVAVADAIRWAGGGGELFDSGENG